MLFSMYSGTFKLFYNLCQSIGAQNKYGAILYQTSGAKLHQCYISKSIHARNLFFFWDRFCFLLACAVKDSEI